MDTVYSRFVLGANDERIVGRLVDHKVGRLLNDIVLVMMMLIMMLGR